MIKTSLRTSLSGVAAIVLLAGFALPTADARTISAPRAEHLAVADMVIFKGKVVDSKGEPVEGVPVRLEPFGRNSQDGLKRPGMGNKQSSHSNLPGGSMDSDALVMQNSNRAYAAKTDSEGRFEIKNVTKGRYTYTAGTKASGMRRGMVNLTGDPTEEKEMEIKLSPPTRGGQQGWG